MQQGKLRMRLRARLLATGLVCVTAWAVARPAPMFAGGRGAGGRATMPERIVLRYFTDLAAHRYYAAHLLEAPCSHTVRTPNGPGAPGLSKYQARTGWPPESARIERQFIHTIRVTGIAPFHRRFLTIGHMRGYRVYGYFSFAKPRGQAGNPNEPTRYTALAVFTWQCWGRWWVDPQWLFSTYQYGSSDIQISHSVGGERRTAQRLPPDHHHRAALWSLGHRSVVVARGRTIRLGVRHLGGGAGE